MTSPARRTKAGPSGAAGGQATMNLTRSNISAMRTRFTKFKSWLRATTSRVETDTALVIEYGDGYEDVLVNINRSSIYIGSIYNRIPLTQEHFWRA